MIHLHPLERLRFQRSVERLHRLGPRAVAELLAEVADRTGKRSYVLNLVTEYSTRLTPQMLRLADGDRFPPWQLVEVKQADSVLAVNLTEARSPARCRQHLDADLPTR